MAYTLKDDLASGGSTPRSIGTVTSTAYVANGWVPASSYTLTKVAVALLKVNAPTCAITAQIFAAGASNKPTGTALATATATLDASELGASFAYYDFLFTGLALSSGTQYFLSLSVSAVDATNYVRWAYSSGANDRATSADGAAWSEDSTNATQGVFRTYETVPAAAPSSLATLGVGPRGICRGLCRGM